MLDSFEDLFNMEVRPNCDICYFYGSETQYLCVWAGSVPVFAGLFFLVPFGSSCIFLVVRYSSIHRPGELADSVEGPYRLSVVNIEAFFIEGFIGVDFLAVFGGGVINRVAVLVFGEVDFEVFLSLFEHFSRPRIGFLHLLFLLYNFSYTV